MKAARSQRWRVGDRFMLNRWREGFEPSVFEVTKITPHWIYHWCESLDLGDRGFGGKGPRYARRCPKVWFYRRLARREVVRVRYDD